MWTSSFPSTVYWKDCPFLTSSLGTLSEIIVYAGIPSTLFHWACVFILMPVPYRLHYCSSIYIFEIRKWLLQLCPPLSILLWLSGSPWDPMWILGWFFCFWASTSGEAIWVPGTIGILIGSALNLAITLGRGTFNNSVCPSPGAGVPFHLFVSEIFCIFQCTGPLLTWLNLSLTILFFLMILYMHVNMDFFSFRLFIAIV